MLKPINQAAATQEQQVRTGEGFAPPAVFFVVDNEDLGPSSSGVGDALVGVLLTAFG